MKTIIVLKQSQRAIIQVGDTGFRSTLDFNKATQFASLDDAEAALRQLAILSEVHLLDAYQMPKLTKLEQFCYDNGDRSSAWLASQLNRTEAAVSAAYSRGHHKVEESAAIARIWAIQGFIRK